MLACVVLSTPVHAEITKEIGPDGTVTYIWDEAFSPTIYVSYKPALGFGAEAYAGVSKHPQRDSSLTARDARGIFEYCAKIVMQKEAVEKRAAAQHKI